MSTNAYIGIEGHEGRVTFVYVHGSGQIRDGAGEVLREHYIARDRVWDLIARGNMTALWPEPSENHYATWKGESAEDVIARHADTRAAFFRGKAGAWLYLFTLEDKWLVKPVGDEGVTPLKRCGR